MTYQRILMKGLWWWNNATRCFVNWVSIRENVEEWWVVWVLKIIDFLLSKSFWQISWFFSPFSAAEISRVFIDLWRFSMVMGWMKINEIRVNFEVNWNWLHLKISSSSQKNGRKMKFCRIWWNLVGKNSRNI